MHTGNEHVPKQRASKELEDPVPRSQPPPSVEWPALSKFLRAAQQGWYEEACMLCHQGAVEALHALRVNPSHPKGVDYFVVLR